MTVHVELDALTAIHGSGAPAALPVAVVPEVTVLQGAGIRMTVHVQFDALTAMHRFGTPAALPVAVVPEVTVLRGPGSG